MTGEEHAATMDAVAYWKQFPVTWDPSEAGDYVWGIVEHLGEVKIRDEWIPEIRIRTGDGVLVKVLASQKRLLAQLVELKPRVGDRIKIRYDGEDQRSAPGMRPTQRWTVGVRNGVTE